MGSIMTITNSLAVLANNASALVAGLTTNATAITTVTTTAINANGSVGSNGQVLTSNGSAVYWANATGGGATGGGTDAVFNINNLTVNTNYTIASSRGAVTAGPIYIANGVTVTISANSRWVIL
jgi:hypothetical protein